MRVSWVRLIFIVNPVCTIEWKRITCVDILEIFSVSGTGKGIHVGVVINNAFIIIFKLPLCLFIV